MADSGRRKLPPKKRIFDSGDEKEGGEQEESQDREDQAENQQKEQNEDQMDTEEPVAGPSQVINIGIFL